MIIKIRSFTLVLLLIMLFSGTISGNEGDTLTWITIKHNDVSLSGLTVGHYWIEMLDENGNVESYGWYPGTDNVVKLVAGAPGILLSPDQHVGEGATEEFHPILTADLTPDQIRKGIRDFANSYQGENWALFTQNCHTFVDELMKYVGIKIVDPTPIPEWLVHTAYAPSEEIDAPLIPPPPTSDVLSGSDVSGPSGGPQTVTPQNDNYILTHLPPCDCNWPTIDPRPPRDGDWMYNKNDGKYYTTYGGYYWLYDENDLALVDGYAKSLNPFPGSPPESSSVAGVGPLF